ncbi:polysaccharide deacetylase family protein [Helicobacter sp. 11S02596-1]|uniref:polysaccharide deacetylase family protein n=1 Tax=Helicobacter sp. 11S02596-1 TaxID=1476194 RepID=UPI000BA702FC|nr:polysaccharide deacetylase family protein [Helicobacter sp. 11S02596-1]PAF45196.1 polysaccharide deacetylase [Helicobacter sp. 11S02596-1]
MKKALLNQLSQLKIIQKIFRGNASILMLHRIAPLENNRLSPNENMKVTPDFLEDFITTSLSEGYRFISLDTLYEGLIQGNLEKKSLVITIDDGYKDNFIFGYPIFKKYQIPFCIYVCTSFPQRSHNMWWFALEDYLLESDMVTIAGEKIDVKNVKDKEYAFLRLRDIIIANSSSYEDANSIMNKLGIFYDPRHYDSLSMGWEEIKLLSQDPIATIGNHTHSHPIFNNLSPDQITQDIQTANELFKSKINYTPKHFAYPFGSRIEVSSRHFELIKNLNFKTATTTRQGTIYPQHKKFLTALPRIFFHENFRLENSFKIRKKIIITA